MCKTQNGCKKFPWKFKRGNSVKHRLIPLEKAPGNRPLLCTRVINHFFLFILNDIDNKYVWIILTAEVKNRAIFILTVYLECLKKGNTIWTVSI